MKDDLINKTTIYALYNNTSGHEYGLFTDKIIGIKQGDQIVVLDDKCLQYLEKVVGAKFKI